MKRHPLEKREPLSAWADTWLLIAVCMAGLSAYAGWVLVIWGAK